MGLSQEKIDELLFKRYAMTRWEDLEDWICSTKKPGDRFTVYDLAEEREISTITASRQIQSYLHAQRRPESPTLHILKREGRTRAAVWSIGARPVDERILNDTVYRDVVVKLTKAWVPDYTHMAGLNPTLARRKERVIEDVVVHSLTMLEHILANMGEE